MYDLNIHVTAHHRREIWDYFPGVDQFDKFLDVENKYVCTLLYSCDMAHICVLIIRMRGNTERRVHQGLVNYLSTFAAHSSFFLQVLVGCWPSERMVMGLKVCQHLYDTLVLQPEVLSTHDD